MNELFATMDWTLLRKQKHWLMERAVMDQSEMATGLLHLIDGIQDAAVEQGVEETLVFGELTTLFRETIRG
jgi:hypothetical protein